MANVVAILAKASKGERTNLPRPRKTPKTGNYRNAGPTLQNQ